MNISGTLMSYFFYCKRKCWLFYKKIQLEENSEDVRIGRVLHDLESENGKSEILIDGVKFDKITRSHVVEYKKSDSDSISARMQLLLYLYKLKKKGITLKGKLIYIETKKEEIIELDDKSEQELEKIFLDIEHLLSLDAPPFITNPKKCRKCAYSEYCLI